VIKLSNSPHYSLKNALKNARLSMHKHTAVCGVNLKLNRYRETMRLRIYGEYKRTPKSSYLVTKLSSSYFGPRL